jgi:hypothetical protein
VVRRKDIPPIKNHGAPGEPRGILELDRFSEASLKQWKTLSGDLDELERTLYYALEPERKRLRPELIAALQQQINEPLELQRWARIATYTHSLNPLSAAGSLLGCGGRFNPGGDLEQGTLIDTDEDAAAVGRINASGAGIVFVGLGCPKQERWMAEHRGRVNAVMIGVGAAFDFHAGTVQRAPAWMRDNGLEWLHRFASEPRRLWRRYLVTNTLFILGAVRQLLFGGKLRR